MERTEIFCSKEELSKFLNFKRVDTLELKLFDAYNNVQKGVEMIEYLKNNLDSLNPKIKSIIFTVPYEKLPKELFLSICDFYYNTKPNRELSLSINVNHSHTNGFFYEEKTLNWDVETIIKANTEIDKICQFIKDSNFSPMEALACIHNYVSSITAYKGSPLHSWYQKDQFFAGAYLYLPEFVCLGYSSLMKEIIDNLDIPGLKCEILSISFKHLKKCKSESHARCFIKVKDDKYGVNQTVFDDPTWDNEETLSHKYAHFAMPNDSLEQKKNGLYEYYIPERIEFKKDKSKHEFVDENLYYDNFNHSQNQISQHMIETIYFNVLEKTLPNLNCDEIYKILTKMANDSFNEQTIREFKGNLISKNLMLSKNEAKRLYTENRINLKTDHSNNEITL